MAKKAGNRINIKMRSTESPHQYVTTKSRINNPERIELKKYDPVVRKHVVYKETK